MGLCPYGTVCCSVLERVVEHGWARDTDMIVLDRRAETWTPYDVIGRGLGLDTDTMEALPYSILIVLMLRPWALRARSVHSTFSLFCLSCIDSIDSV